MSHDVSCYAELCLFLPIHVDVQEMSTRRWSRFLDTNDVKGVKARGEFWRREAVKTVRSLAGETRKKRKYSPLEFPQGKGDPGPQDSLEIWVLWVFNV